METKPLFAVIGLVGVATIFPLCAMLAARPPSLQPADWAAWVQAFGSIAAILGAWLISKREADRAETRERAQRAADAADLREAAVGLAALGFKRLKIAARLIAEERHRADVKEIAFSIAEERELLQKFELHRLRTGDAMVSFSAVIGLLGYAERSVRRLDRALDSGPLGVEAAVDRCISELRDAVEGADRQGKDLRGIMDGAVAKVS